MKLELKNFRVRGGSEETQAFEAKLFIDGVEACVVSNTGKGEPTEFSEWRVEVRVNAYAKTLPPDVSEHGTLECDADLLILELVGAEMHARMLKRMMKNKVLFLRDLNLFASSKKLDDATLAKTLANPNLKEELNATNVLNLLPFEEALKLFIESANAKS